MALLALGCALRQPTSFPVAPLAVEAGANGSLRHVYDTDGDGAGDYVEVLSSGGRVVELAFGEVGTVGLTETVSRGGEASKRCRRVLIILDSIPFRLVEQAHAGGRFRHFYPPSRVVAPFPVLTDLCLNEFFGVSPATAAETEFFDGERLRGGWGAYAESDNSKWLSHVDVHLPYGQHGSVYLDSEAWFDHELALIEEALVEGDCGDTVAYVVSTSALGIAGGRDGHVAGLVRLDRFCQSLMHRFRGDIEITLMSDHGHSLQASRRVALRKVARRMGYRVGKRLDGPGDLVIPAFGLVSCASVYTLAPARFAADIASVEGIELVAYRRGDGVIGVVDRTGEAVISRKGDSYRYGVVRGDPLRLAKVFQRLAVAGAVNVDGFVADTALRESVFSSYYPDALYRLCRAFDGLMEHPSQVMISLEDGWFWGSPFMSKFLSARAIHGSLNRNNSFAFVMSTVAALPGTIRMDELKMVLDRCGLVHGPGKGSPVR